MQELQLTNQMEIIGGGVGTCMCCCGSSRL